MDESRKILHNIYQAALSSVNGQHCVMAYLSKSTTKSAVYMIAIGKAAMAMAQGAQQVLGERLQAGLVITKHGYAAQLPGLQCCSAAHPIPDQSSLDAGQALLAFISKLPRHSEVLFLLSGGASALVEVLPPDKSLAQLRSVNQELLSSGLDIQAVNAIRQTYSLIKGGQLARYFADHHVTQLVISDVIGDDLTAIGSGLLATTQTNPNIDTFIIANLAQALQAAQQCAQQLQLQTHIATDYLQGDVAQAAQVIWQTLQDAAPGVYLWGGETTVNLPANPGRGGRNQHLALLLAQYCQGHTGYYFLVAGTDGSDGPGDDAGAIVDSETLARAKAQGLDAAICLANANSGEFLAASGDLLHTGPTGTNVMDIVIALKLP